MNILQDIMGLITKRKIKTPSDNDYIVSAAYTNTQERLKPQPKMEASLLNIGALKSYIINSIPSPSPTPLAYKVYKATFLPNPGEFTGNVSIITNTFQEITWVKVSTGYYIGTFATTIDPTLLIVNMKQVQKQDDADALRAYIDYTYDEDTISIFCFTAAGTLTNLYPYLYGSPDFVVNVEYYGT